MKEATFTELRNHARLYFDIVEAGEPVRILRNGKPIAALVRIDQDKLEDWLLSTVADPPIGVSLEESPEALRAAARPVAYGKRQIKGLTKAEADGFAEVLAE